MTQAETESGNPNIALLLYSRATMSVHPPHTLSVCHFCSMFFSERGVVITTRQCLRHHLLLLAGWCARTMVVGMHVFLHGCTQTKPTALIQANQIHSPIHLEKPPSTLLVHSASGGSPLFDLANENKSLAQCLAVETQTQELLYS